MPRATMQSVPTIAGRKTVRTMLLAYFRRALFAGVGIAASVWLLQYLTNPHDINHCVIMNIGDTEFEDVTVILNCGQKRYEQFFGDIRPNQLRVKNIEGAFFDGSVEIRSKNFPILTAQIRPPGRYCGSMVIRLTTRPTAVDVNWNQLPGTDE